MLTTNLLRRTLLPTITGFSFIRAASTMATPSSSFALDKGIFNQTLYSHMRNFWLGDIAPDAATPNFNAAQKWFGVGKSDEEKEAFDGECREKFVHALEAIGPEKLALPAFESYERDIESAQDISHPFLEEVRTAQAEDEKRGADTLMSLLLLLDQMTRNIYRDPAGLHKVYTHYDRLSLALLYASMHRLPSNPVDLPFYQRKPVYKTWLLMPLLHSEHLPSHDLWAKIVAQERKAIEAAGEEATLEFLNKSEEAEEQHVSLLRRFGRYPHRNEFLGRETTDAEREYLKDGDTFGVKTSGKKEEGKTPSQLNTELHRCGLQLPPDDPRGTTVMAPSNAARTREPKVAAVQSSAQAMTRQVKRDKKARKKANRARAWTVQQDVQESVMKALGAMQIDHKAGHADDEVGLSEEEPLDDLTSNVSACFKQETDADVDMSQLPLSSQPTSRPTARVTRPLIPSDSLAHTGQQPILHVASQPQKSKRERRAELKGQALNEKQLRAEKEERRRLAEQLAGLAPLKKQTKTLMIMAHGPKQASVMFKKLKKKHQLDKPAWTAALKKSKAVLKKRASKQTAVGPVESQDHRMESIAEGSVDGLDSYFSSSLEPNDAGDDDEDQQSLSEQRVEKQVNAPAYEGEEIANRMRTARKIVGQDHEYGTYGAMHGEQGQDDTFISDMVSHFQHKGVAFDDASQRFTCFQAASACPAVANQTGTETVFRSPSTKQKFKRPRREKRVRRIQNQQAQPMARSQVKINPMPKHQAIARIRVLQTRASNMSGFEKRLEEEKARRTKEEQEWKQIHEKEDPAAMRRLLWKSAFGRAIIKQEDTDVTDDLASDVSYSSEWDPEQIAEQVAEQVQAAPQDSASCVSFLRGEASLRGRGRFCEDQRLPEETGPHSVGLGMTREQPRPPQSLCLSESLPMPTQTPVVRLPGMMQQFGRHDTFATGPTSTPALAAEMQVPVTSYSKSAESMPGKDEAAAQATPDTPVANMRNELAEPEPAAVPAPGVVQAGKHAQRILSNSLSQYTQGIGRLGQLLTEAARSPVQMAQTYRAHILQQGSENFALGDELVPKQDVVAWLDARTAEMLH